MKKISNTIMMFAMIFGLLVNILTPIYLMIATLNLKEFLPDWFVIVNFILSGIILIFIIMLFYIITFGNNKNDKNNDN